MNMLSKPQPGHPWYFRYHFFDESEYITNPELLNRDMHAIGVAIGTCMDL